MLKHILQKKKFLATAVFGLRQSLLVIAYDKNNSCGKNTII